MITTICKQSDSCKARLIEDYVQGGTVISERDVLAIATTCSDSYKLACVKACKLSSMQESSMLQLLRGMSDSYKRDMIQYCVQLLSSLSSSTLSNVFRDTSDSYKRGSMRS